MKLKHWRPSNLLLSQLLHLFVGSTAVFATVALRHPWYDGALVILSIAAIKETTFDIWVEGDTYRDGVIDWSFYALGCLAAGAVSAL